MKLLALLPILAIVAIAGCVGQSAAPAPGAAPAPTTPTGVPSLPTEGPGVTEPATQPLPPPINSEGVGFVVVSPQPGQQIFYNDINVVVSQVKFTVVPPGTEPKQGEGYFVIMLDSLPPVQLFESDGPGYSYTFMDVPKGDHNLKVEAVSADGRSLDPPIVRSLIFTTA